MVVAFNESHTEIYVDPTALGGDVILVDISGSVSGPNAILLRTAVAAMTKGTKSHGKFAIPKPVGATAIIAAVKHCLDIPNCGTIYLFTDGEENCWDGPLTVGKEDDGSPMVVDVSFGIAGDAPNDGGYRAPHTPGTAAILADFLQESGVKVCILGIGNAAKPMVDNMLGRKNVYCGHVTHGADIRAVVSTVRTLKRISKGGRSSVTRNGTQHALLVSLSDDVQEAIQQMTPAEMDEYEDAVGSTIIADTAIVTAKDLKRHMELVFNAYDEPIPDEHVKNIKAALLLAIEAMCDGEMPGALITSKHSAIIGVPDNWRPFRRHCNRLLSRLAGEDVLQRAAAIGACGKTVTENGNQHKFAAGCAQYSCAIPKVAVTTLAEDADYCTARAALPAPKIKKRKHSSSGAPVKKQRVD
tara:strand:- start:756 stop:1994 length:1239 start_codon:yes stop_codon:yes gene_type:complete